MLDQLPNELIVAIIWMVAPRDVLLGLAQTNRWLRSIARDPQIWFALHQRSFTTFTEALKHQQEELNEHEGNKAYGDENELVEVTAGSEKEERDEITDWCEEYWKRWKEQEKLKRRYEFIISAIQHIQSRGCGERGLFKNSGDPLRLATMLDAYAGGVGVELIFEPNEDVHTIAQAVRTTLGTDPSGILNTRYSHRHYKFINIGENLAAEFPCSKAHGPGSVHLLPQDSELKKQLRVLLSSENWAHPLQEEAFHRLIALLRSIADQEERSRMNVPNLAIGFVRPLFFSPSSRQFVSISKQPEVLAAHKLLMFLIWHHREIWPERDYTAYQPPLQ